MKSGPARASRSAIVATAALSMAAAALVAAACRRAPEERSPARNERGLAAPRLRVSVSPTSLDLGPLPFDEPHAASVTIRNDGPAVVELRAGERSRFCALGSLPAALRAGDSSPFVVTCRADLAGPLRERLVVRTNDPAVASVPIDVVGQVVPLLAFDVASVDIRTPVGEPRATEARLVGSRAAAAQLVLVGAVPADIALESLPATARGSPGVRVRCRAHAAGTHVGHLMFSTALDRPREVGLSWACHVKGTLTVEPDNVSFDLVGGHARPRAIEVRSTQPDFVLREPQIATGPFAARLDPAHPGRIEVTFMGLPADSENGDPRGVSGTLVILSNDRSEPRREVPLLAFGPARAN